MPVNNRRPFLYVYKFLCVCLYVDVFAPEHELCSSRVPVQVCTLAVNTPAHTSPGLDRVLRIRIFYNTVEGELLPRS